LLPNEAIKQILIVNILLYLPGADPGFQVRRGGAVKKIVTSGGRLENIWGISCEKSRFYAKKSFFSPILGGGGHMLGVPPPGSAPGYWVKRFFLMHIHFFFLIKILKFYSISDIFGTQCIACVDTFIESVID
jgi:hypothetical protein